MFSSNNTLSTKKNKHLGVTFSIDKMSQYYETQTCLKHETRHKKTTYYINILQTLSQYCATKANLMHVFEYQQHRILQDETLCVQFFTSSLYSESSEHYEDDILTLRKLLEMQPSGVLKEQDACMIAQQLVENFEMPPASINIDNIIIHNQSKLKIWLVNFQDLS